MERLLLIILTIASASCQRPSFAGSRPIGFPELTDISTTPRDELGNRFGEPDATTQRLPIEAKGDKNLVDRLSKLPIDQQPFWFINWQALEEHRKNPQTFPQRPNPFIEVNPPNSGINTNTANTDFGNRNSASNFDNSNFGNRNSALNFDNSNFGNRNSDSNFDTSNFGNRRTNADTKTRDTNIKTNSQRPSQNPVNPVQSNTKISTTNSNTKLDNQNTNIESVNSNSDLNFRFQDDTSNPNSGNVGSTNQQNDGDDYWDEDSVDTSSNVKSTPPSFHRVRLQRYEHF